MTAGLRTTTTAPLAISVNIPRMPALGMSRAGVCASSAVSGSSSMPRNSHIANGSASTTCHQPCGRNVLLPGSGSMSKRLPKSRLPESSARTPKTAMTARERTATIVAKRKEISAPAMFTARKTA